MLAPAGLSEIRSVCLSDRFERKCDLEGRRVRRRAILAPVGLSEIKSVCLSDRFGRKCGLGRRGVRHRGGLGMIGDAPTRARANRGNPGRSEPRLRSWMEWRDDAIVVSDRFERKSGPGQPRKGSSPLDGRRMM